MTDLDRPPALGKLLAELNVNLSSGTDDVLADLDAGETRANLGLLGLCSRSNGRGRLG